MFQKLILTLLLNLFCQSAYAALPAGALWELNASATANNVNGGGFNPGNASFLTNLTTDTNTGNTATPVVSSASYNFVAGDVGAWVLVVSGTNWYANTMCKIASVAANKATLTAGAGTCIQKSTTTGFWSASSNVGVASVGTPTNGTFGIDYSQGTAAITTNTDLASLNGTTAPCQVTSTGLPFGVNHVGNFIHITAGTNWTAGWYEIVSVSVVTATLDRACGSSATLTSGTYYVGGALSMNSTLDDDIMEAVVGGNTIFTKSGSYTLGEAVAVASTSCTGTIPCPNIGYTTLRGDSTTGTNRPLWASAANTFTNGQYRMFYNHRVSGTANPVYVNGSGSEMRNVSCVNPSTSANRTCISINASSPAFNIEAVAQNGDALGTSGDDKVFGGYFHDSNRGMNISTARHDMSNIIISACRTAGMLVADSNKQIKNSTIHGWATPRGTGISISASITNIKMYSNIIDGWTTGIAGATAQQFSNSGSYNFFYNNTADTSLYSADPTDVTGTNPTYTAVAELTGSTATTSGSVLTDAGATFTSVTDNVDYLHVFSGTGVTTGGYLITSHTTTTLTVNNALGTSSAGNVVYSVPTGRNLAIGTPLKGLGYPGAFAGSSTTGYMDPGAVQRQESSSSTDLLGVIQ